MNTPGMTPPLTASTNSNPSPRPFRLDAQMHFTELPGTAALLLVAMNALGLAGDGFAVWNAWRLGIHFKLVLAGHLFQLGLEMNLAQPTDDGFIARRVALDHEGRILHRQLAENIEQALLVTLLFRLDSQPGHRLRKFERYQMDMIFVVRVVQHGIEIHFFNFGNRPDIAGHQFINFNDILGLAVDTNVRP